MCQSLLRCLGLSLLALCSSACGALQHSYRFTPEPEVSAVSGHALEGKRLALDLSGVPDTLSARAGGHGYDVNGIRHHVRQLIQGVFGHEEWVDDPGQADVVLGVELTLDLSGTFGGTRATCHATVNLRDPGGLTLAQGRAENRASYPTMGNGGRNCEIAAIGAVSGALDNALAEL